MASADSLKAGDNVLVRGRVEQVFGDVAEITFADWWPRWSAVLVKREQITVIPGGPPPPAAVRKAGT